MQVAYLVRPLGFSAYVYPVGQDVNVFCMPLCNYRFFHMLTLHSGFGVLACIIVTILNLNFARLSVGAATFPAPEFDVLFPIRV